MYLCINVNDTVIHIRRKRGQFVGIWNSSQLRAASFTNHTQTQNKQCMHPFKTRKHIHKQSI